MTKQRTLYLPVLNRENKSRYPLRKTAARFLNYNENYIFYEQRRVLMNINPHMRTRKWMKEKNIYKHFYKTVGTALSNKIAEREWSRKNIHTENPNIDLVYDPKTFESCDDEDVIPDISCPKETIWNAIKLLTIAHSLLLNRNTNIDINISTVSSSSPNQIQESSNKSCKCSSRHDIKAPTSCSLCN